MYRDAADLIPTTRPVPDRAALANKNIVAWTAAKIFRSSMDSFFRIGGRQKLFALFERSLKHSLAHAEIRRIHLHRAKDRPNRVASHHRKMLCSEARLVM